MKKQNFFLKLFLIAIFPFFGILTLNAQNFPERPSPPKLVNDFSGILNSDEAKTLEEKLVKFNDSTSTQIAVVTLNDIEGMDKAEYAQRLAEKWGIGQKGKSNGILILIKPTGGKGQKQAYIAVGYGLEPVIPDAIAKRIVENEMIPNFKNNNFYKGIDKATNVLISLAKKEFTAAQYQKKYEKSAWLKYLPFIAIILIFLLLKIVGRAQKNINSRGSSLPFWTTLWLFSGSGGGSGGSGWGGGSSGDSGFGGFGGGSFGGGGAGGSW
ncbi:MAG: TPM domain-containing protein [Bacteroidetes bacterium]|nr:TPM domain-containing protein [Bacteroidota bacterium]